MVENSVSVIRDDKDAPVNMVILSKDITDTPRGNGELVIDDGEAVRKITRQTLESFGYRVLVAGDGAEAAALCSGSTRRSMSLLQTS